MNDNFPAMWSAIQQAVYIVFGPIIIWILGAAVAGSALLAAWFFSTSLWRKYIG